jgi:hypothetical protein
VEALCHQTITPSTSLFSHVVCLAKATLKKGTLQASGSRRILTPMVASIVGHPDIV